MVLDRLELVGPHGSSRLFPLVDAIRNTGYRYLTHMYLWHTPLAHADMVVLASHLSSRNDLEQLEFLHNDMSRDGARILGEALTGNRGVKALRILFNPIGTDGFRELCHGLETNETVTKVSVCHCELDEGAGAVAGDAIARTAWTTLALDGNQIRAAGLATMAQGLAGTTYLETLSLQDCEIDQYCKPPHDILSAMAALCPALLLNKSLSEIDMGGNTVGEAAGKALLDMHAARKEAKMKVRGGKLTSRQCTFAQRPSFPLMDVMPP